MHFMQEAKTCLTFGLQSLKCCELLLRHLLSYQSSSHVDLLQSLSGCSHDLFAERRKRQRAHVLVQSGLNAGRKMASVAFMFPVRRSDPFECQSCGGCLVADGQGHHQHAIAIGDVGTYCIDRDWECKFAVIDAHAPFIDQQFLDLLQHGTLVSMENEATIVGDFDQHVLGFQPSHRSRDHQALACSVDLDRNMLLLHLFLHPFSLYNAFSLLMRSPQCLLPLRTYPETCKEETRSHC